MIALDQHLAILVLICGKEVAVRELLFFFVEDIDDDTNEEVQKEKGADNHEEAEEYDVAGVFVLPRHLVDLSRVNNGPHYV